MPRITAPTVAEHRARQHSALLAAAREMLLANGPQAVTPAAVGARAGLARSSVYKYFSATTDILAQVVEDIFAVWTERVRRATQAEPDPAARVAVYVRTHLEFAQSDDRRVGYAASAGLPPSPSNTSWSCTSGSAPHCGRHWPTAATPIPRSPRS